ncbi:sorting nexin-10A [Acanthopagrus latus]|uniref:sorting nexin-10A n=1 Tax=Acanthopagrus latus TaxID=8177 RepID=UPI00187BCA6D|nr:sorting nexin-10A [Acanthopagrus latus]XP_036948047.1 sorting nexin-10A [Acanthopagrus latus]
MDSVLNTLSKTEFISICVRDPRVVKDDLWHKHIDYEICVHTNSMCFRRKTSCVRRRYNEFVWLRHCLDQNALSLELPKLPPWNPFFSLRNTQQLLQRMKGMQEFLEIVLREPLLLSDSRLHLFLQSDLSITRMERCALGKTRYTVGEAIQRSSSGFISRLEDKGCDSDSESCSSSLSCGLSVDTSLQGSHLTFFESSDREPELFPCLSETPLTAP